MKVRNIIGLYVGQDLPHKLAYHNYDRLITLVLHDSPRLWKKNYTLDPNKMKDRNKKQWALKEDVDLLESVIKTQKKIVSSAKKYSRRAGFARVKCRQGKDGSESKFFFFFIVVVVFVTVMHSSPSCHALLTVMHL